MKHKEKGVRELELEPFVAGHDRRLLQLAKPINALQCGSGALARHVTEPVNHSPLDELPAIARPALPRLLCRDHAVRDSGIRVQGGERRGINPEFS